MSLLNGIKSFKSKLTRIGTKEPLNFLSIVLILGLDLFVLVNLFQGLDLQTRQLESPREIIPYECINLIQDIETNNDKESTVFNALDRNNDYYFNIENKYSADFINEKNKDKIDPKCREIFDAAINLGNNEELKWQHEEIERLEVTKYDYESKISQYENNYDTMLLEEIANQPSQDSVIDGKVNDIKIIIRDLNNEISTINLRVSNIKEKLMQSEEVETFLGVIAKNKKEILEKDKKLRFWYPIKKTGIQFLFLLPVLLLFLYLYRRSLRKNSEFWSIYTVILQVYKSIFYFFVYPLTQNRFGHRVNNLPARGFGYPLPGFIQYLGAMLRSKHHAIYPLRNS